MTVAGLISSIKANMIPTLLALKSAKNLKVLENKEFVDLFLYKSMNASSDSEVRLLKVFTMIN